MEGVYRIPAHRFRDIKRMRSMGAIFQAIREEFMNQGFDYSTDIRFRTWVDDEGNLNQEYIL